MVDKSKVELKFISNGHSIDVRFVVVSENNLTSLCQTISSLDGLSGNLQIQAKDSEGYNWAQGNLTFRSFSFHCLLSACPIEQGNSEVERHAVRNLNGMTDTYLLRLSDFSKVKTAKLTENEYTQEFLKKFQEATKAKSFDGRFMWIDYV